jgi:hypothetical protein
MNFEEILKEDLIFVRKHFEGKEEVNKRVYDFLFLKVLFSFYWFIAYLGIVKFLDKLNK